MDKPQLIRLIHVAKGKLKIDDETYRTLLANIANGKTSCSEMNHKELESVYSALREKGFKRSFKKTPAKVKTAEIAKIRAIWITMHRHGFVKNGDDAALNAYVKRMTAALNNGQGVEELSWLSYSLAYRVLESIKQWHIRLMLKDLAAKQIPRPLNKYGEEARDYDVIANAYEARK
ncbi:phage gp16-like protein|uniref:Phage gp16-like protein n=1 Tax=Brenneria salicis ATCC 15712 = DSM 30166 TaxID=714314 RepID=A0A366I7X1_9GAMM|nr:regulatory protein GemA [Brenneria salicis]NMN90552.1 phage gp16-like protein [Brenneria salicis ATCC 15712 = DSM 30166]RBP64882.1 phage gp16-like protein [Brenneria salicis ATCC 15712 = DSM 30166]RLM31598.1 hypothetical protein BHG07_04900 [Brenneria salicis ATCC 15712 = DSM 30166]